MGQSLNTDINFVKRTTVRNLLCGSLILLHGGSRDEQLGPYEFGASNVLLTC